MGWYLVCENDNISEQNMLRDETNVIRASGTGAELKFGIFNKKVKLIIKNLGCFKRE